MRALALFLAGLLGAAMAQVDEAAMHTPLVQMKLPESVRPRKTFDIMVRLSNPSKDVIYNGGLVLNLHPVGIKYLKSWYKKGKTQYTSHPIHKGSQLNFTHIEIPAKKHIMYKIKVLTDKCAQEEMFFSAYSYVNNPPNYAQSSVLTKRVLTVRGKKDPPCAPTPAPTHAPTGAPTKMPTESPTARPTPAPTPAPTRAPTKAPTCQPLFLDCPTNQVVTSQVICTVESYCTSSSAQCPENANYPPVGNVILNGGFENSSSQVTDWTPISPSSPGGIVSAREWEGSYSLRQGQTTFDSNGYAGGYFQPAEGLTTGQTATVRFALWSDGGTASSICWSGFLGSTQLIADPCTFRNNQWNYMRCDNVPVTSNSPNLKYLFYQRPTYWWIDGISVVANP